MPFKLIEEKFIDGEWRWTYGIKIIFRDQLITAITITDHYQDNHPEITNELILKILDKKLNNKWIDPLPDSYLLWGREVFRFDTFYLDERYRLIFWFKDNTNNHLWIRNCYPVD